MYDMGILKKILDITEADFDTVCRLREEKVREHSDHVQEQEEVQLITSPNGIILTIALPTSVGYFDK